MADVATAPEQKVSPTENGLTNGSPTKHQSPAEPLVSSEQLAKSADFPIFDAEKKEYKFSELYDRPGRNLIVFVRHAFCGMCHDFLRELNSVITPEELKNLKTPTSIVIVFPGQPHLIKDYIERTNLQYPIYTDPDEHKLYDILSMTSSWGAGSKKPEYQKDGLGKIAAKGFMLTVSNGTNMLKGGSFSQLGGEFLFEDGKNVWLHRMQNTRDHTTPRELRKVLGLDG